jgi:hypothetical protein
VTGPVRAVAAVMGTLLLASTLAACAGDERPPPAATPPTVPSVPATPPAPTPPAAPTIDLASVDPCELVTKEEAEVILGLGVDEPTRRELTDTRTCTYYAPPTGPVGKVDVFVGQGAENVLNFNRDLLSHEFTEITDIDADEAYEKPFEYYIRKADLWVVILVVRIVPAEQVQDRIGLAARRAASRF